MENTKNISLNYFTQLLSNIEVGNHLDLDNMKEKLKSAYLSEKPFIDELADRKVFDYIDKFYNKEESQETLSSFILEKPLEHLKQSFKRFLLTHEDIIRLNFNKTVVTKSKDSKLSVLSSYFIPNHEVCYYLYESLDFLSNVLSENREQNSSIPFFRQNIALKRVSQNLSLFVQSLTTSISEIKTADNQTLINLKLYISQISPEASALSMISFEANETWYTFHTKLDRICTLLESIDSHFCTITDEFKRTLSKDKKL